MNDEFQEPWRDSVATDCPVVDAGPSTSATSEAKDFRNKFARALFYNKSGISVAEMYNMRGYDRGAWAKSSEAIVKKKVVEQVLKYYIRHVERMNEHDEKRVERA
ncbi:unnamed protein product [Rotaria magnacalcarata]|uniref:Uncharacterized protein n=1 Tax=Rotaria magnacalcarata TaxID=392030 RepID=A0A819P6K8_9BILA|nr:unnamed protein product [Rotaria magnacalcarata]